MLGKNYEDMSPKRKRPYKRAMEKRLFVQEHILDNADLETA
jgi:hypothetical protein